MGEWGDDGGLVGQPLPPVPRLVIAASHGRCGKTTVSLGLVAGLAARGYAVQPFKKGPDYIDPSWLSRAAGRPCRNLDLFFCGPEETRTAFAHGVRGADLAVIEGNHGLYDGLDLEGSGSTAELARILGAPVILVVDVTRMTRSVAALVRGFVDFEPGIQIAGVILNRVGGPRHEEILTRTIEQYCSVPVLGVIPRRRELAIPDRHLGLVPAGEEDRQAAILEEVCRMARDHLDLDGILAVARTAGNLPERRPAVAAVETIGAPRPQVRIGYFSDEAFHFYYAENLEALRAAGAELLPVSPLAGRGLPPVDALYLGGGFPEVFAGRLAQNAAMREAVRRAVRDGMPVYAECGGLMYLCRSLVYQGREYPMAGALPADVVMEDRPQAHGYTVLEVTGKNPFFPLGARIKAHEFHHSRLVNLDGSRTRFALDVRRGRGIDGEHDGLVYHNVLAGYHHLFAPGVPGWAAALVSRAKEYRQTHPAAGTAADRSTGGRRTRIGTAEGPGLGGQGGRPHIDRL